MPISQPRENEQEKDFISRCMGEMNTEYPDEKQRSAICYTAWSDKDKIPEKMKLETVNTHDVEIFDTGIWKGKQYTEKDIDEMINNFKNKVAEPYITIDHSEIATKQFKDALQVPALGWVNDLKRVGTKLVATFKEVPKKLAELIEAGALKKKSIEFLNNAIVNGMKYNNLLVGVTFTGANGLTEVNTLNDYFSYYKKDVIQMTNDSTIVSLSNLDKEETMSENTIALKKEEYDATMEKMKSIEAENVKLKQEQENLIQEKKNIIKLEAENYVTLKIQEGKLLPKFKDMYTAQYIMFKNSPETLKCFCEEIESRDKVLNFGETPKISGHQTNFKYEPETLNFKIGNSINYEELMDNVNAVMKSKGITFEKACVECGLANASEFGKGE